MGALFAANALSHRGCAFRVMNRCVRTGRGRRWCVCDTECGAATWSVWVSSLPSRNGAREPVEKREVVTDPSRLHLNCHSAP